MMLLLGMTPSVVSPGLGCFLGLSEESTIPLVVAQSSVSTVYNPGCVAVGVWVIIAGSIGLA